MAQLYVTGSTFFKRTLGQSSTLPAEDKIFINAGETIKYVESSLRNSGEHFQIETVDQIAPWGRKGFLYSNHVLLENSDFSNRLVRLVRTADIYQDILHEAQRIRGGEDNTCVAFQSEALRKMGILVPIKQGNGGNISLVTKPYAAWIRNNLQSLEVDDSSKLQPGDLCFSADERGFPGFPAHTYIFTSYYSRTHAYVVDNQGNNYIRNLIDYAPKTPFAYALRISTNYNLNFSQALLPVDQETDFYEASAMIRDIPEYRE